jgi:hypothetical protein
MEPEGSLPFHNSPLLVPALSQMNPATPSHPISLRSILILSSYLCLGFTSDLFPLVFRNKILYAFVISPTRATCPAHLIFLDFITLKLLIMQSSPDSRHFLPLRSSYSSPVVSGHAGRTGLLSAISCGV